MERNMAQRQTVIYNLLSWNDEKRLYIFDESQGADTSFTVTNKWFPLMKANRTGDSERYACCVVRINEDATLTVVTQDVQPSRTEASVIFLNPYNFQVSVTNKAHNSSSTKYSPIDMAHQALIWDNVHGNKSLGAFRLSGHYSSKSNDNKLVLVINKEMQDLNPLVFDSENYKPDGDIVSFTAEEANGNTLEVTSNSIGFVPLEKFSRTNVSTTIRTNDGLLGAVVSISSLYIPPVMTPAIRVYLEQEGPYFAFSSVTSTEMLPRMRSYSAIRIQRMRMSCVSSCPSGTTCVNTTCLADACLTCPLECEMTDGVWHCPKVSPPKPGDDNGPGNDGGGGGGGDEKPDPPLPDPGKDKEPVPEPEPTPWETTWRWVVLAAGILIFIAIIVMAYFIIK